MIKFKDRFLKLKEANLPNSDEMAKKYGHDRIIKMFYNENNFGPSPKVAQLVKVEDANIYPEYKEPELIKLLAEKFDMKEDNFYISNGSDAILDAIPNLFASVSKNHNVVIPSLTFGRIETTCVVEGLEIKKVDLVDGKIDLNKMLEAIDENTSIVYVVNPNMPTGTFNTHQEIMSFLHKVPEDVLVVIDEAYIEFAQGIENTYRFDKAIIETFDNVIITHTWSKLYGIASFRIGYMVARPYIVDLFRKAYQYLPVNRFSLKAAEVVLQDEEYYQGLLMKYEIEKERYYATLDKLGFKYYKTYGNFIYFEAPRVNEFDEYLVSKYAVKIRSVQNKAVRVTIGTPEENTLVLKALEEFYA